MKTLVGAAFMPENRDWKDELPIWAALAMDKECRLDWRSLYRSCTRQDEYVCDVWIYTGNPIDTQEVTLFILFKVG